MPPPVSSVNEKPEGAGDCSRSSVNPSLSIIGDLVDLPHFPHLQKCYTAFFGKVLHSVFRENVTQPYNQGKSVIPLPTIHLQSPPVQVERAERLNREAEERSPLRE
mgnify:CR=1 FL=1